MTYILNCRTLFCLSGVLIACAITPMAHANDYDDVNRLTQSGKLNDALVRADQFLGNKPRDPQMRFLKGVVQLDAGKRKEAITTFLQLTQDAPELPEPYNNLAVLYAADGQFDKARAVLESAIQINPDYATAHENLGDIYARMASNAYAAALQMDPRNSRVPAKVAVMQKLLGALPVKNADLPPPKGSIVVVSAKPTPIQAALAASPLAPASVLTKSADTAAQVAEVERVVQGWSAALTGQDVSMYLASYSQAFVPLGGLSHEAWAEQERTRLVDKDSTSMDLQNLVVTFDGVVATAKFRQSYRTNALKVTRRKTLELVREQGQWRIRKES